MTHVIVTGFRHSTLGAMANQQQPACGDDPSHQSLHRPRDVITEPNVLKIRKPLFHSCPQGTRIRIATNNCLQGHGEPSDLEGVCQTRKKAWCQAS